MAHDTSITKVPHMARTSTRREGMIVSANCGTRVWWKGRVKQCGRHLLGGDSLGRVEGKHLVYKVFSLGRDLIPPWGREIIPGSVTHDMRVTHGMPRVMVRV